MEKGRCNKSGIHICFVLFCFFLFEEPLTHIHQPTTGFWHNSSGTGADRAADGLVNGRRHSLQSGWFKQWMEVSRSSKGLEYCPGAKENKNWNFPGVWGDAAAWRTLPQGTANPRSSRKKPMWLKKECPTIPLLPSKITQTLLICPHLQERTEEEWGRGGCR